MGTRNNLLGAAKGWPGVPTERDRNPSGILVNVGLLERELGSVEYRLSRQKAGAARHSELQAQKLQLLKALDIENAKLEQARSKGP